MILLIFPHQLFAEHPGLDYEIDAVALIEDSLFFGDYQYPLKFHKQKLWLHRTTMKRYQQELESRGYSTHYFDYDQGKQSLRKHLKSLCKPKESKHAKFAVAEPTDFILEKRLSRFCDELNVELLTLPTPGFINRPEENAKYRQGKKRWFMADFYKWQRQRLEILVDRGEPVGGKWSFDEDNRKKVPKQLLGKIPTIPKLKFDAIDNDAVEYIKQNFQDNPGSIAQLYYPTSHDAARKWLDQFLQHRFEQFGVYEDAIVENESWLWHSVLTPALNTGLITPQEVVTSTLEYADQNEVPINSLEGFIRQVIGWREFMRATYQDLGVTMRTTNHWGHDRKIPDCFYDATTGIEPIDDTINRILKTGYCHHIERLMVLGGFMFLCEFDPDEIYKWFMELFIDSYDWVMVTNVYAMSQHADGGPDYNQALFLRLILRTKNESLQKRRIGATPGMDCIGAGSGITAKNCRKTRAGP